MIELVYNYSVRDEDPGNGLGYLKVRSRVAYAAAAQLVSRRGRWRRWLAAGIRQH